jgi:hypothetical protein
MRRFSPRYRYLLASLVVAAIAAVPAAAQAQVVAPPPLVAGVSVDAQGVLHRQMFLDPGGRLMLVARMNAKAALNPKIAAGSKLRKISLNRLEAAINDALANGRVPTEEMQYLAGLTRVEYVFCYPDSKDVVIAGPAEGWVKDLSGRVCGIQTGRPLIELQDLIVALRAFPTGGKGVGVIGCSIDPTKEGLERLSQFLRLHGSHATPNETDALVDNLRTALGPQMVHVLGVPANTHFAQVLVEADYRMKLIGIGLERPPVNMKSYVDRANPAMVSRNALQRWYFVPDYKCVTVSADELAMELVGDGVKLVGADEVVNSDGSRQASGNSNGASKAWVEQFTKNYAKIAANAPVYAQLRNLIDLSVAAAFIQQHDYAGKIDWHMTALASEATLSVQTFTAPEQVESAVNAIWHGHTLMTPIGGGVHIEARQALTSSYLQRDDDSKVDHARQQIDVKNLSKGQWWWD